MEWCFTLLVCSSSTVDGICEVASLSWKHPSFFPVITYFVCFILVFFHACLSVPRQVLDDLNGIVDKINNTIVAKLPIITAFNDTINDVVTNLTVDAAAQLVRFRTRVDGYATDLTQFSADLHQTSSDVAAASTLSTAFDFNSFISSTEKVQTAVTGVNVSSAEVRRAFHV